MVRLCRQIARELKLHGINLDKLRHFKDSAKTDVSSPKGALFYGPYLRSDDTSSSIEIDGAAQHGLTPNEMHRIYNLNTRVDELIRCGFSITRDSFENERMYKLFVSKAIEFIVSGSTEFEYDSEYLQLADEMIATFNDISNNHDLLKC